MEVDPIVVLFYAVFGISPGRAGSTGSSSSWHASGVQHRGLQQIIGAKTIGPYVRWRPPRSSIPPMDDWGDFQSVPSI
ncbi:hypothetical protein [Paenibacillus lemnae]|uniref:hypothetical protein n=1 Tax=Paenibacillus lemnae TaxID=1330551 RepID=UPI00146AE837|nr:hypothetical protein [Paenibacillus lemnae]